MLVATGSDREEQTLVTHPGPVPKAVALKAVAR
jgi:hypothetical protein